MNRERLYEILRPDSAGIAARVFRGAHHAMVAAGIAVVLADTVELWRETFGPLFETSFRLVSAFFVAEYVLRLIAAPGAPGAEHRSPRRARLDWGLSIVGVVAFFGGVAGVAV